MINFLCLSTIVLAQEIDMGVFESNLPNRIDVKIKPDFTVSGDLSFTTFVYTIRWADDEHSLSTSISPVYIAPYNLQPFGAPQFHNGYFYQRFYGINRPVGATIMPGEERHIASFTYTGDEDVYFELINDD